MTPLIEKFLTVLCLIFIGTGLIAGLLELAIYFNDWWSYPLGLGLSILVILGGFEIVERIRE